MEAKGAWNVVADAAKAPGQTKNAIDFQFGPARQVDAASALIPADTSSDMGFNMGYAGSGTESVEIDTAGNVAPVSYTHLYDEVRRPEGCYTKLTLMSR